MDNRLELNPEGLTDGSVRIRHLVEGDAHAYAAGMFDPAVARFAHMPAAEYTSETVREEIRTTIANGLRDDQLAVLAVVDAADEEFLGSIVLSNLDWIRGSGEVGFWLAPAARGRGVATEAVHLLCRWCFDQLGLNIVRAHTRMTDTASQQVLEHAGFQRTSGPTTVVLATGDSTGTITYWHRSDHCIPHQRDSAHPPPADLPTMKPVPQGIGDRSVMMTFQADRSSSPHIVHETARLRMKPAGAARGGVNGGWWPRSRDTIAELPGLVTALAHPIGVISLIALSSNTWAPGPHRIVVDDRVIALNRFSHQNAHTIMVLGKDRSQTTLLVIPPEAPEHVAEEALRIASDGQNTASPAQILADGWLANQSQSDVPKPRIANAHKQSDTGDEHRSL